MMHARRDRSLAGHKTSKNSADTGNPASECHEQDSGKSDQCTTDRSRDWSKITHSLRHTSMLRAKNEYHFAHDETDCNLLARRFTSGESSGSLFTVKAPGSVSPSRTLGFC